MTSLILCESLCPLKRSASPTITSPRMVMKMPIHWLGTRRRPRKATESRPVKTMTAPRSIWKLEALVMLRATTRDKRKQRTHKHVQQSGADRAHAPSWGTYRHTWWRWPSCHTWQEGKRGADWSSGPGSSWVLGFVCHDKLRCRRRQDSSARPETSPPPVEEERGEKKRCPGLTLISRCVSLTHKAEFIVSLSYFTWRKGWENLCSGSSWQPLAENMSAHLSDRKT